MYEEYTVGQYRLAGQDVSGEARVNKLYESESDNDQKGRDGFIKKTEAINKSSRTKEAALEAPIVDVDWDWWQAQGSKFTPTFLCHCHPCQFADQPSPLRVATAPEQPRPGSTVERQVGPFTFHSYSNRELTFFRYHQLSWCEWTVIQLVTGSILAAIMSPRKVETVREYDYMVTSYCTFATWV